MKRRNLLQLGCGVVGLALVVIWWRGCDGGGAPTWSASSTNLGRLNRLIVVPDGVESVEWATMEMPGGNDWVLIARMTVTPELTDELRAATRLERRNLARGDGAEWFTQGLDASPTDFYAPNLFVKSPLLHGWAAVPEDDVVLVWLFTM